MDVIFDGVKKGYSSEEEEEEYIPDEEVDESKNFDIRALIIGTIYKIFNL
jgi:hypothetical protein